MRGPGRTVEEILGRIAGGQYGLVRRSQLLDAGISSTGIERRLAKGLLIQEYRGIYRVGHRAPSIEATYLAAVFAGGDGTLLGGRATAHLLRVIRGSPPPPEVICQRRIPGVITHRTRTTDRRDATTHRGIPVTTLPRTLLDLAGVLSLHALARACHEAGVLYDTTPAQVKLVLARRRTAPGAANLRRVIDGEAPVTLSKLERRFLEVLREAGLPLPETNRPASGRRVDCRWPAQRLTVELDRYRYHSSRHAWDRRREREAHARGDDFRRFTYGDVFEHPGSMLRELREVLSA